MQSLRCPKKESHRLEADHNTRQKASLLYVGWLLTIRHLEPRACESSFHHFAACKPAQGLKIRSSKRLAFGGSGFQGASLEPLSYANANILLRRGFANCREISRFRLQFALAFLGWFAFRFPFALPTRPFQPPTRAPPPARAPASPAPPAPRGVAAVPRSPRAAQRTTATAPRRPAPRRPKRRPPGRRPPRPWHAIRKGTQVCIVFMYLFLCFCCVGTKK